MARTRNGDVRERILVAGLACFTMRGYRGSTVAEVAGVAGVAPATVYRHFRSKAGLVEALGREDLVASRDGKKEAILEAGLALFGREGMSGTSMSQVAEDAGVSRATLYARFPSKAALLTALLDDAATGLELGSIPVQLETRTVQILTWLASPRQDALVRILISEAPRNPAAKRALARLLDRGADGLTIGLAIKGRSRKAARMLARLFMSQLIGIALLAGLVPETVMGDETLGEVAERIATLLMRVGRTESGV